MKEAKIVKTEEAKEGFRQKVAELVEDMWEKIGKHHHGIYGTPGHLPALDADLSESGNVLTYNIELPGMDSDDVEVEVSAERLTIRGEKQDEQKDSAENYIFRERRYGYVERSFMLPANIDKDKVKAVFDKGVLKVSVPYKAGNKTKATKIKVSRT